MKGYVKRKIHSRINDTIFSDFTETIWAFLKASNVKSDNFDPYRNTGYTTTQQSPLPVNAQIRQITPESRTMKVLGQIALGAIEVVVKEQDVNLVKMAEKIKYKDREYTTFNKSLGNRAQITEIAFGFSRIVLFLAGK